MNFGERIKKIRIDNDLTQEAMAEKLSVSRQAISNWENNKNFPDLEMIITIAQTFSLTLDYLILGDERDMEDITEKLIKDGSEVRKARFNTIMVAIGSGLFILGVVLLLAKGFTPEYVDGVGLLHESFYLLPLGFLSLFMSIITFSIVGIKKLISKMRSKNK